MLMNSWIWILGFYMAGVAADFGTCNFESCSGFCCGDNCCPNFCCKGQCCDDPNAGDDGDISTGAIIGIIIGAFFLFAVFAIIARCCYRRRTTVRRTVIITEDTTYGSVGTNVPRRGYSTHQIHTAVVHPPPPYQASHGHHTNPPGHSQVLPSVVAPQAPGNGTMPASNANVGPHMRHMQTAQGTGVPTMATTSGMAQQPPAYSQ